MASKVAKKCLRQIWKDIVYLATVEVQFNWKEKAKQHSRATFKTDEVLFLPTYLGRRTSKIRVGEILLEVDVATIILGSEVKITFLQATIFYQLN